MKHPPLLVVTSNIANNALSVNKSLQMTEIKLSVQDYLNQNLNRRHVKKEDY